MAVTAPRSTIPTLREAVARFITTRRVRGLKSIRDEVSALSGAATGRVTGCSASGPALAQSQLGDLRVDRVQPHELVEWFARRFPDTLAPATRKRGMSHLRQFVEYVVASGWAADELRQACMSMPDSNPRGEWLYPEETDAFSRAVAAADVDPFDRFLYELVRDTGLRCEEACRVRFGDLDQRTSVLVVIGKGRGDGKRREVPVSDAFIERWLEHAATHRIARNGYMLFSRPSTIGAGGDATAQVRGERRTRPMSSQAARKAFARLQDAVEAAHPQLLLRFNLTPKVLRRTFACTHVILHELGLGGLDLESLRQALGHASLETTQVYLADVASYLTSIRRPTSVGEGAASIVKYLSEVV